MADLRDKMDLARGIQNHKRAAKAGGPRKIARSFGRAAGSDRFPKRKAKR